MWSSLLAASAAHAGSCCGGSTTPFPIRVAPCEHLVAGLSAGTEVTVARWDGTGALVAPGIEEEAGVAELGAALRLDRRWQASLVAPLRVTRRASEAEQALGGGLGDLVAQVQGEPVDEREHGPPVPVVSLGLRLPTGRDWTESDRALLEDVTGLPGLGTTLGLALERTLGRTPLWLGADGTFAPTADATLQSDLSLTASVGRSLGEHWTVLGTGSFTTSWIADASARAVTTPRVGARVVRGERLAWRAWAAVDAGLPVPGLGRSASDEVSATLGAAWVR